MAGALILAVGIAAKIAPAVAFGGAMILAVAAGRALAVSTVTRIRASGFEMIWTTKARVSQVRRGETITLEAELRNRGLDDARGVNLRPVASSLLDVRIEPSVVDLPAASKVRFSMTITPKRVGRWGIHGIALEVRGTPLGGEGLYEVPLLFANPHGIEALPRPLATFLKSARGGRSRHAAEIGRSSNLRGEGETLRELRELLPGDPFKRIAWKASARRGKLLVREMEREERDVVWLVVDASVELWAGEAGTAPLDFTVDEVAAIAAKHLARGDRVGLGVFASRLRTWLTPDHSPNQAARIASALASAASMVDADRCELGERELAQLVVDHLRPLDARALADLPRGDLEALSLRAESMRARAPFAPRIPEAASPRESRLRHYLASFGVEVPPRVDDEHPKAELQLAGILDEIAKEKRSRASIVHVWAPAPERGSRMEHALLRLRKRHVEVRWTMPAFTPSLANEGANGDDVQGIVREAVRYRVEATHVRGEHALRKMGIRGRHVHGSRSSRIDE